jgi:putative flippase GtrA
MSTALRRTSGYTDQPAAQPEVARAPSVHERAAGVLGRWPVLRSLIADRRVRYVFAGGVAAGVYYLLFWIGWLLFSAWVPYLAMLIIVNFMTAAITFPIYRNGVFRYEGSWLPAFLRFYVTCFWALAYGLIMMPVLVELVHLHVLLALAIVTVTQPLINYQLQRFWAFRHRH